MTVLIFLFQEVSHDTRRFRFALPSMEHVLGLPLGKFLMKSPSVACINYTIRNFVEIFPPLFCIWNTAHVAGAVTESSEIVSSCCE